MDIFRKFFLELVLRQLILSQLVSSQISVLTRTGKWVSLGLIGGLWGFVVEKWAKIAPLREDFRNVPQPLLLGVASIPFIDAPDG